MGIGDAYDEHDNHDEHLYSRRASKNSLYSAASGSTHPSSPTFSSRRGSAVTVNLHGDSDPDAHQRNTAYPRTRHNGEFDNPYLIHGLPSPSRSSRYAHHDEIVGNRNAHAHASGSLHSNTPANYDGIIKHPSRYPYARSHHHHPYAHAYSYYSSSGRSPSFSHSSPQPAREHPLSTSQHNDNIDDAFAHPRSHPHPYYSQKRHSFAALRTATAGAGSSSSFNTGGGGGSGINGMSPLNGPVVRLPSIDHGLPPFSGTEGSMLLPLRRGSLTDPLLHAHARNTTASSSNLSMQASSFASGSGGAGPNSYGGGGNNGPSHQYKLFPAQMQPSSPLVASASSPATATTTAAPRFGAKQTKSLFPQQHGATSGSSTGALAAGGPASSVSPAIHTPTSLGAEPSPATVSLLGTKRKLDPSNDATTVTDSVGEPGTLVAVGDYFTSAAPNVTKAVTVPASSSGLPLPALNANKRRASQTYLTRNETERPAEPGKATRAVPLPTPTSTDSAAGESGSAASSDRRSSDGSNGIPANANGVNSTASRYGNIVQRQPLSYMKEVDAESKSGYAFPTQRPSSGSSAPANSGPIEQPAHYSSHDAPQPYPSHTNLYHPPGPSSNYPRDYPRMEYQNASVGPSVLQQPPPSAFQTSAGHSNQFHSPIDGVHGSSLQPDLRSKANAVFGSARPGYPTNAQPPLSVHASSAGIGGPGLQMSRPPGALSGSRVDHLKLPSAGSGQFGADMDSQGASNLPYARSPALKVSHKIAERKRRREMKELFDELRDCVPTVPGSSTPGAAAPAPPPADVGGRGIKSSKWEILAKAIEYINKLQYEHQELSNQVIELQGLNQAFQEELHAIKNGHGGIASADGPLTGQFSGVEGAAGSIAGDASSVVSNGPPSAGLMHYSDPSHGRSYAQQSTAYQQSQTHQVSSVDPSPSPASGHVMPPLQHQSHSMPAVIGHHPVLSPVPALHHSHSQSHAHSASQSPMQYPISAPPHLQTHFLGPNIGNEHSPQQPFGQQIRQHHQTYLPAHQHHQRTLSNPSQFEHAGSAPPTLQQHPHQQVQFHPGQSILGNNSVANSPVPTHQNLGFLPQSSQYQSNGSLPPDPKHGRAIFSTQGQGQHRPASSLRSHTSNQSIHSLHSVSPQPQHIQLQHQQAMQQRHHNVMQEDWSPAYTSPRALPSQTSNPTAPGPTSQSATPMMSSVNAGY